MEDVGIERQILGVKIIPCGMHTARDPTRRSVNMTHWFRTCATILLNAHRTLQSCYCLETIGPGALCTLKLYDCR